MAGRVQPPAQWHRAAGRGQGRVRTKDELRYVDLVLLVHDDRDALAIVHDRHAARRLVNLDSDLGHGGVALFVVGGVDQDLVKNLVQTRHV